MPDTFRAYRIFNEDGRIRGRLVQTELDELTPGEVVIHAINSSVNYKDALAATGAGKILRRFPLIGGIDAAGDVVSSSDPRFLKGDPVVVTGYDLGVSQDGGFSEYVRVPADWVVTLPTGLSHFEAMTIGTAGFTAALSIRQLEHNGLVPRNGPVIVTGATGGVGSLAVAMLARLGYHIAAVTGKENQHDYLRELGAKEILPRGTIQMGTRPLEKAMWAGAVDPVGGEMLAWLTRTMMPHASIASSGLTGGTELHTTVMPFILRGINLLGVDSGTCPMSTRLEVWRRLATDMKPPRLDRIAREIRLEDLDSAFRTLLNGTAVGRTVVKIT